MLGSVVMLLSGVTMLWVGFFGFFNVKVVLIPMIVYIIGNGLVLSNSMVGALMPFADIAGSSGALFGFIQMLGIFVASAIAAAQHSENQIMMAVILSALGLLSLLINHTIVSRGQQIEG